ncbi:MAG TPA: ATP-binding protein, partial [Rhodocyclaceae bacterium]|nr:ATP-binding protein [Rhodocyclaceae bacterium]
CLVDLKSRIAAMALVLFLAAIWLSSFLANRFLSRDLETLLAAQQFSAASYVADDLEQRVRLRLQSLSAIGGEIDAPLLADPGRLQQFLAHRPLLRILFSVGVTAISANGVAVAAYPLSTFQPQLPFKNMEYFQLAVATGQPAVGMPRVGRVSGKPAIGFAAPIFGKDGRIIGVLAGFSLLSDPTLFGSVEKTPVGRTGWMAVSAPAYGLIVSSSDPTRILDRVASPGANRMFDRFVAGYEGSGVAVNSKGIETLTSAKLIPSAGWIAQAVLPTAEAFAPIRNLTARTYAVALVLSLLVTMLTWFTIRRMLQPLAETSQQIEKMASGTSPLTTIHVDRKDEIGAVQAGFNRLVVARNDAEARANAQSHHIAELSRSLLMAQEAEKQRLALEIHDVVSPNIAAIKIQLKMVSDDVSGSQERGVLPQLEDVHALIEDTEASLRGICADLRPTALEYGGLAAAIKEWGQMFSSRTGIPVAVVANNPSEKLPADVETKLFRIVQEALTNCAKHARAKRIEVSWTITADQGVLVISDDGVGFDTSKTAQQRRGSSLGLVTMGERAEFIGGDFSLQSQPGQGTRITVQGDRHKVAWSFPPEPLAVS